MKSVRAVPLMRPVRVSTDLAKASFVGTALHIEFSLKLCLELGASELYPWGKKKKRPHVRSNPGGNAKAKSAHG